MKLLKWSTQLEMDTFVGLCNDNANFDPAGVTIYISDTYAHTTDTSIWWCLRSPLENELYSANLGVKFN